MKHISFIDTEVSEADNKAYDFGAVNENDDKQTVVRAETDRRH